jgi:hypothetical protein
MNPILIHKSDSTVFANVNKFLTFNLETGLDLTGYSAKFILGWVTKEVADISFKQFEIILGAEDTKQLRLGKQYGTIILTDSNGNIKTVTNTIPFEVTTAVVENEYQEIDLTIPESSGVDIKLKVGVSTVTSVNGMTGDVNLTIPSIEGLATEQQLAQGLNTKQDKGDYALREEIPSLEGYVKDTDIATSEKAGIAKINLAYGININNQSLTILKASDNEVKGKGNLYRPIVPANLDLAVKTGVTTNTIELSEDEKTNAKQWLGYATPTDIMQAIASIPQFNMSIVNELPLAGEKMTLYLVPKEGTNNDVYDEYIWIEQSSSFEHLGTTAVDLSDYVKNTDYATGSKAGIVKVQQMFGLQATANSGIFGVVNTLDNYNAMKEHGIVCKGTLDNIKNNYVKEAITTNDIELTDDEKTSARTWLGAVGSTDYATSSKAGVVRISGYGLNISSSNGVIYGSVLDNNLYPTVYPQYLISRGTLDNVLTQYSKTVLTTEADYNALATKDANTLYLIEE